MNDERKIIYDKLMEIANLLESESSDDKLIAQKINEFLKLMGPDYERIPTDLKKSLGIAYGSAIAETDVPTKAAYTRTALSLLRGATKIAGGSKIQLKEIDEHIKNIDKEIASCEQSEEPLLDFLWKYSNRAIDYITEKIFDGYGEFRSSGFQFHKGDNK